MKALIVDDNADDRKILKLNMEQHGCAVTEALDGQDGLKKAIIDKPELIISDALMPNMDGFQFLRSVKKNDALKNIPFIFYSAVYTGYNEEELALSLGADAFIVKPKDPNEFWAALTAILESCKLKKHEPRPELLQAEEEYLRRYSHIVATKLEEKYKELQQANARLVNSEQCYRNLFASMRDVVVIANLDRVIIDVNQPAMRELFGYETGELVGKNTRILYAGEDDYDFAGREVFYKKEFVKGRLIEASFRKKNNDVFNGELYALKLIGDNNEPTGNIAVIRDITRERRLEQQLRQAQKMEAVGQLAGGVAHDFNNILTAIVGYGNLALMKLEEDNPLRSNIEHILSAAERAAVLTHSLLAFSRKQIINPKPVNVNDIILHVQKFLSRLIGEDIEIRTRLIDRDVTIMADSGQIEQVLMNLATNARDTMPEGGALTIESGVTEIDEEYIKAHGYGTHGVYALISVSDTGTGMEERVRERIFEPFFTTKEVGKGTGLGLAIVYGIVKQHNGYVNCYSEPGRGTTFKIYLPLISKAAGKELRKADLTPLKRGTETLLLAEDDPEVRKLLRTMLEEYGYTVIEAADGEEAIEKFIDKKEAIQGVIVDVIMPKMNGREVYKRIKEMKPEIKPLFISGYTADIIHKRGILDEGLDFISKPVSPRELLKKLRELFGD